MQNTATPTQQVRLPEDRQILVFTDMDGSLLDHHDYSFDPVKPLLKQLEQLSVPLILCTSKTRAEVEPWRLRLENTHPFVIENGAGIVLPDNPGRAWNYPFNRLRGHHSLERKAGAIEIAFSRPRSHWQKLLEQVQGDFPGMYISFAELGIEGIMETTGLNREDAEKANRRSYSEPVLWMGNDSEKQRFIQSVTRLGAQVLQGGRFLHLVDTGNKGDALLWLCDFYQRHLDRPVFSIAAGDSPNDLAMLEAADIAVCIRSPVSAPLSPGQKTGGKVIYSKQYGPAGWYETIYPLFNPGTPRQQGNEV